MYLSCFGDMERLSTAYKTWAFDKTYIVKSFNVAAILKNSYILQE